MTKKLLLAGILPLGVILLVGATSVVTNGTLQFGDVAGGDYTQVEADGTLAFNGAATVWNDIAIGFASGKVPAVANYPAWTAFTTNTAAYTFDIDDYIDVQADEIPHSYKVGSDMEVHLHWATNGTEGSDKDVAWQVYYTAGDMGEAFAAEATDSVVVTIPAGTADRHHFYTDLTDITSANLSIGAIGLLRVKRIASGNEPASDPFGLMIGVHYESDTIGSRQEATK